MQSFLSLEILFLTLITPTLLCTTFGCNFTDIIDVSLRLGHDFSTIICSAPIGFHSVTYFYNKYEIVMWAGPYPEGVGTPNVFFKLGPNKRYAGP